MMDFQRTVLLIALIVVSYLLYDAWQSDYATPPEPPVASTANGSTPNATQSINSTDISAAETTDIPSIGGEAPPPVANGAVQSSDTIVAETTSSGTTIDVTTDVLELTIDTLGGNIINAKLLDYPESLDERNVPFTLLENTPGEIYIAQSGLRGPDGPDLSSGQAQYSSAQATYTMGEQDDQLQVDLHYQGADGINVTKSFVFKRGEYLIDVAYIVDNQSAQTWQGQFYSQIKRQEPQRERAGFFTFPGFTGGAISSPDKRYEKLSFNELRQGDLDRQVTGGWLAMVQRYFVSAWIPEPTADYRYYTQVSNVDQSVWLGMLGPWLQADPGQQITTDAHFYVGPTVADNLKSAAPGLELTVDYGWLWPISQFLFWVMKHLFSILGNWGLAIIGVTLLIKIIFFPLSATSYRSMANMRRLQPKIASLKERHGSDRQKMSQAMMELYKKEKLNPLGGCLPILIQIPVFIALYWVLIESVELRQAPFYFWIHDLSIKDPFYILPVVMGISMFLQQKLNPAPPDPLQAKVMMMMPVVFTLMFLNFPAGLMLYWIANNVLSMAQQWTINRRIDHQNEARKRGGGRKKMIQNKKVKT